jgi:hypothetical protein
MYVVGLPLLVVLVMLLAFRVSTTRTGGSCAGRSALSGTPRGGTARAGCQVPAEKEAIGARSQPASRRDAFRISPWYSWSYTISDCLPTHDDTLVTAVTVAPPASSATSRSRKERHALGWCCASVRLHHTSM